MHWLAQYLCWSGFHFKLESSIPIWPERTSFFTMKASLLATSGLFRHQKQGMGLGTNFNKTRERMWVDDTTCKKWKEDWLPWTIIGVSLREPHLWEKLIDCTYMYVCMYVCMYENYVCMYVCWPLLSNQSFYRQIAGCGMGVARWS